MNVVRSAGGGGGSGVGNNYKLDSENVIASQPISRPTSSIAELMQKTNFSKDEIRHLYRKFKQDSPSGEVSKSHFASIMATLFPSGECFRYSVFLFRNIDRTNRGYIRFEDLVTALSILIHGSIEDRLSWVFDLYDVNRDGKLTRKALILLVASVFQLIVPICKPNLAAMTKTIEERTDQLFRNWDIQGNGLVSKEDFLRYCLQDEMIKHSMNMLKSDIRF